MFEKLYCNIIKKCIFTIIKKIPTVQKRISIKDIANAAGVSTTTVSFVLNNQGPEKRISASLEKHVREIAEKMHYTPNLLAKSLRTGKTNTIGLVVEDIANTFFSNIAKTIEEKAMSSDYRIFYCSTNGVPQRAKDMLHLLTERKVDGFIITPTQDLEEDIIGLQNKEIPFVLMDRFYPNLNTNYVLSNNYKGAKSAADHLLENGHSNIAIVTTDSNQIQMRDRLNGFRDTLTKKNITIKDDDILIVPYDSTPKKAVQLIEKHLLKKYSAVFFCTNYLGIYGIEAINNLKFNIPTDLSVVCYDEHEVFRLHQPAITCVAQPLQAIGEAAIEFLINNMSKKETTTQQKTFDCMLMKRGSVLNKQ